MIVSHYNATIKPKSGRIVYRPARENSYSIAQTGNIWVFLKNFITAQKEIKMNILFFPSPKQDLMYVYELKALYDKWAQTLPPERTLRVLRDGSVEETALDTYLTQVVLSEMPASFAVAFSNAPS